MVGFLRFHNAFGVGIITHSFCSLFSVEPGPTRLPTGGWVWIKAPPPTTGWYRAVYRTQFAFLNPRRINMRCYRCGGAMIYEKFYGNSEHFFGWKCISCGEIVDRLILENRQHPQRWYGSSAINLNILGSLIRRKERWETRWSKA